MFLSYICYVYVYVYVYVCLYAQISGTLIARITNFGDNIF